MGEVLFTSLLVSNLSILQVAFYQLITITIDPFGVKNIITTTRCVITCIVTWLVSGGFVVTVKFTSGRYSLVIMCLITISLATTSICYIFIYRSVAKVEYNGNGQLEERKKENQRVLRTFCIILGTTVFFMLYPIVYGCFQVYYPGDSFLDCLYDAQEMMIITNYIVNNIIYWWRLKEFRSLISTCTKRCNTVNPQVIEFWSVAYLGRGQAKGHATGGTCRSTTPSANNKRRKYGKDEKRKAKREKGKKNCDQLGLSPSRYAR